MDRGAHFFKSDFQIHSPRDAAWTNIGPGHPLTDPPFTAAELTVLATRPTTAADRLTYAQAFIRACRERGLGAVALTDHHDICFIKYVQLAAQGLDLAGFNAATFVPDPTRQNPIVFPGLELTLRVPCQALVLLDANAGVPLQEALLGALGLSPPHDELSAQGPNPSDLPFDSLEELEDRLKTPTLAGRVIILPHVGQNAHRSLIRQDGFSQKYAKMPCVGGYIEQDHSAFDNGHSNKLNGGDPNYGNKAVGVFQTSDARHADFRLLACRTTWVKMAEPTAEGLRQACLSRGSRLFQVEPHLPTRFISKVEITNSVYLGALEQNLNPQFNAFIGGRGTGKSTFLEFIRWAMQDQPVDLSAENGVDRKRQHFLNTLAEVGGVVRVHWSIDGTPHVVTFDPSHGILKLKVGGDAERDASAEEIKTLLPIRAYSQKQLSSVSGKRSELQRFVEEPIRDRLRAFENDFEGQRTAIRTNYTNRRRRRDLSSQVQLQQTQLASVQERIRTLQAGLKNMPAEAELAMQEHSGRLQEQGYINAAEERWADLLSDLDKAGLQFQPPLKPTLPEGDTPQKNRLTNIEMQIDVRVEVLRKAVVKAKAEFEDSMKVVGGLIDQWTADHEKHLSILATAQSQQKVNAVALAQLAQLRKEEAAALAEINRLQKLLAATPDGDAALPEAWTKWVGLHTQRSAALAEQCRSLSLQSVSRLAVELQAGRDVDAALTVLEAKLQGARIHPVRWDALRTWLSEDGMAVQRWHSLCKDLLVLVESAGAPSAPAAPLPNLPSWELTEQMRAGIRQALSFDGWLELATLTIQDVPSFFYTGGGTRILFEQASAGQQATVLLTLLLKDATGPLLIDQPEDDLDNAVIGGVIDDIMQAKQHRQLLFASHNANLVVNGDAELVVTFRSVTQNGRARGVVECEGAIDCRPVREAITEVMEGGKKAFELRRQKYGF